MGNSGNRRLLLKKLKKSMVPRRASEGQYSVTDVEAPYDVPGVGRLYFSDKMRGREIADALQAKYPQTPDWYLKAVGAEVDLSAVPKGEKPADLPAPFSFHKHEDGSAAVLDDACCNFFQNR